MKTAFIFPGQGAQFVGMGKDIFNAFPEIRALFSHANERMGVAFTDVMFGTDDSSRDFETELKQTKYTQPALFLHSMAVMKILEATSPQFDMVAGHSLGEYSALVAAKVCTFEEGFELVKIRGALMQEAGEEQPGSMAAVLGMENEQVEQLCTEITASSKGVIQAANFNSPGQVVISGSKDVIEASIPVFQEAGAKRVIPLEVSGAFHSPLMEKAREGLATALHQVSFQNPICPVYLNVTATACSDAGTIKETLLAQLTAPVRWSQSLQQMQAEGATTFVEVGTGNVLSGLVKRTLGRTTETIQVGTKENIEAYIGA